MNQLGNWQRAASELGFEVVAPFRLDTAAGTFEYSFLVRGFGNSEGTVVVLGNSSKEQRHAAAESGFACSSWSDGDEPYDASSIIDVLRDWGWIGEGSPPPWIE